MKDPPPGMSPSTSTPVPLKKKTTTCALTRTYTRVHTNAHTNTDYPNTDLQSDYCQFPSYWLKLGLLWCFEG